MAQHAASRRRGPSRWVILVMALVLVAVAAALIVGLSGGTRKPSAAHAAGHPTTSTSSTTRAPTTTTTSTLPAPAAGFAVGHVTAVGDSVMLDYQDPLSTDIPGIDVQAAVSRQWSAGEALLQQLKSSGQLGAEVVIALGTNGPIAQSDFDTMMGILQGASRIVFVNVHVDRPWQDPNHAILSAGAQRYPRVVIADWNSLANQNPQWFGSDGTHLAIDGPGADALASLITATLSGV